MQYIFQSGSEFIKLKIDRKNKRLEIATSKSNYRFIPQPFWKLYGTLKKTLKGVEPPTEEESKKEMEVIETYNDEEFERKLITDMLNLGYALRKKY